MDQELGKLAEGGAVDLGTKVAASLWQNARTNIVRAFKRGQPLVAGPDAGSSARNTSSGSTQVNTAHGSGNVFAVQSGNQTIDVIRKK